MSSALKCYLQQQKLKQKHQTVDKEESKQVVNTRPSAFRLFNNGFMLSCRKQAVKN